MFNRFDELKKYSEALTVLFVEDNSEARKFTCELLERLFKSVETAQNGLEGLALYDKNYYDIVITDINMPEMNGIQMAEKITPDPNDAEYFALALKLGCGIWSNDKKLKEQDKIKIYSTSDLIELV